MWFLLYFSSFQAPLEWAIGVITSRWNESKWAGGEGLPSIHNVSAATELEGNGHTDKENVSMTEKS